MSLFEFVLAGSTALAPSSIKSAARQTAYIHGSSEPTGDDRAKAQDPNQDRKI